MAQLAQRSPRHGRASLSRAQIAGICLGVMVILVLMAWSARADSDKDIDCYRLANQRTAQAILTQAPSDPYGLDRNHDGKPCQNIPK